MGVKDNSLVNHYIEEVCSLIKCKDVHDDIKLELENHIIETAEALIEVGLSEEDALQKAIANMGKATQVGRELNKAHNQKPAWSIIAISIALSVLGLVCLYLIQTNGLLGRASSPIFIKSLVYVLIGVALLARLYLFDYRKLYSYSNQLYYVSIFILILLLFNGFTTNSIKIYINLGNIGVNIIPVILLLLVIGLSGILCKLNWNSMKSIIYAFALFMIPNLLFTILYARTTGVIYSVIFLVLMLASGGKLKHIIFMFAPVIIIFYFYIIKEPYRVERFIAFINWRKEPLGIGYLNTQIDKLIYSVGVLGKGTSMQTIKLPELHTDLILTYIIYTFGWLGFAALISLILLFIIRIVNITKVVEDNYGKLILYGLITLFSSQFAWNILMIFGLVPVMGISLPFVSYGGTSLVINFMAIGIICSIYKRKNLTNKIIA